MDRVGRRRVGTRLAAVATALMVAATAGCTRSGNPTPPVTPTPEAFEPGADGLGDDYYPTAGNGGYDVKSYDLDIAYDPETDVLDGIAKVTATATASLSSFNLDFVGLKTQSVTVDGAEAEVDQNRGELVVTPAKGITKGTEFVTKVTYGGIPESYNEPSLGGPVGFLNTRDGAVAIGEPEVAASWFPVNDHPRDKATYTIKLTAPDALVAVSNGVLKDKKAAAKAGFTTWTWVESMPMAPYLATMVIGTYRVSEATHDGLPVFTAVHTSLPSSVDATLARTPEVIDFLETVFGPYPFDAMGGVAINDNRIRFALENQTRPIYASAFFSGGGDASWVLAHELAHQWFGDSVSLEAWKEIWLNEGFASYAEWLWEEHLGGDTAQRSFEQNYQSVSSPLWQVPPGDPGKDDLFDRSVYTRGAMTLHALRVTVGDDAFFRILKTWAEEQKNGNVTTEEFIALSEKLSGKELNELFDAWLYQKGRPPLPTP